MSGALLIAGIDEAGRGPLAGPVVAAAVIFPPGAKVIVGLDDSKKLTSQQRERLYQEIIANYDYGVGVVGHQTIDQINILQATFLAMQQAHAGLKLVADVCLIDGNKTNPLITSRQEAIVKGDSKVKQIAAASIIAKVTRDKMMLELDKQYPEYGFAKHKGYCTKSHVAALKLYGRSPVHRLSFRYPGERCCSVD